MYYVVFRIIKNVENTKGKDGIKDMSYIPNTRVKWSISKYGLAKGRKKSPNMYYEKLLPAEMRAKIFYMDAVMNGIENYFANLDIYEEELNKVGIDVDDLNIDAIIDSSKKRRLNANTKKLNMIYRTMMNYLQDDKNTVIVSMIDSIDEYIVDDKGNKLPNPLYEEYKQNFKKIFGEKEYKREFECEEEISSENA